MDFLFVKGTSIRCTPAQCPCIFPSCHRLSVVISGLSNAVRAVCQGRLKVLLEFVPTSTSAWVQIYSFSLCDEAGDQGGDEEEGDPWCKETAPE